MRKILYFLASEVRREVLDDVFEFRVGAAIVQEIYKVLAKSLVGICLHVSSQWCGAEL
jgi:hypothetical protein